MPPLRIYALVMLWSCLRIYSCTMLNVERSLWCLTIRPSPGRRNLDVCPSTTKSAAHLITCILLYSMQLFKDTENCTKILRVLYFTGVAITT
ncbi:hypothetical protein BDZ97DRAFT_849772 [Flammula alnicola]|nr:hypothetical protein BDZ97DRAFT_849772 [Flammula alnicola]